MFRISLLLWLIALAALNFTLLKYSESVIEVSPKFAGLIGLMPLFDLFILSVYLAVTRRFHFTLVRRTVRKYLVDSAAMVSGAILVLGAMSCLLFPEVALLTADLLFVPVDQWTGASQSSPETRRVLHRRLAGDGLIGASDLSDHCSRLYPHLVQARNHAARGRMTAAWDWQIPTDR